jgi:hypothetical protein
MSSARTFYDNRSRLDDHVLMTGSTWSAGKMNGEDKPAELGAEMWRALEKQESRWSKGLKGFNSTVQLLATTDNPAVSRRDSQRRYSLCTLTIVIFNPLSCRLSPSLFDSNRLSVIPCASLDRRITRCFCGMPNAVPMRHLCLCLCVSIQAPSSE